MAKGPQSGFTLDNDGHLRAEELIGELQDRLTKLQGLGDEHIEKAKKKGYAFSYTPDSYSIKFGGSIIVVKIGQGRVAVSHNGTDVMRLFGMNLDLIDLDGLNESLCAIRQYMILDDLAGI